MNPTLSICIPTYNRSGYLRKCIRSVICYSGKEIEIIISDNASTDDSREVVKEFNDPRIFYHRNQQNVGPIGNFYKLLKLAKGEFVFLLTDDDFLFPDCIDTVLSFLQNNDVDSFKCDLIVYNEKSRTSSTYSYLDETRSILKDDFDSQAKVWRSSHVFTGCGYRRNKIPSNFLLTEEFSWYPSMILSGILSDKQGYIARPLAVHIWENELFWGIDNTDKDKILRDSVVETLYQISRYDQPLEKIKIFAANLLDYYLKKYGNTEEKISPRLIGLLDKKIVEELIKANRVTLKRRLKKYIVFVLRYFFKP